MFKKSTVKIFSIIAILLSALGLLISGVFTLIGQGTVSLLFFLGIVEWGFLLYASVIGYQLVSNYHLYEDEYKKVGIRIYLIIAAFILFFFIGLIVGLVLSVILLGGLWALKRNYDEWEQDEPPAS